MAVVKLKKERSRFRQSLLLQCAAQQTHNLLELERQTTVGHVSA